MSGETFLGPQPEAYSSNLVFLMNSCEDISPASQGLGSDLRWDPLWRRVRGWREHRPSSHSCQRVSPRSPGSSPWLPCEGRGSSVRQGHPSWLLPWPPPSLIRCYSLPLPCPLQLLGAGFVTSERWTWRSDAWPSRQEFRDLLCHPHTGSHHEPPTVRWPSTTRPSATGPLPQAAWCSHRPLLC